MRYFLREIWRFFVTGVLLVFAFTCLLLVWYQKREMLTFFSMINGFFFTVLWLNIISIFALFILHAKRKISFRKFRKWRNVSIYLFISLILLGYSVSAYLGGSY